jgi:hypothetical protein
LHKDHAFVYSGFSRQFINAYDEMLTYVAAAAAALRHSCLPRLRTQAISTLIVYFEPQLDLAITYMSAASCYGSIGMASFVSDGCIIPPYAAVSASFLTVPRPAL